MSINILKLEVPLCHDRVMSGKVFVELCVNICLLQKLYAASLMGKGLGDSSSPQL